MSADSFLQGLTSPFYKVKSEAERYADVSAVCSIDLESNLGYYPVIYSSGSKPADVYSLYSDFIDEVKRNLDASVKNLLTAVL